MSHFVLVPGLWLSADSWNEVTAPLHAAGHTSTAVTLPSASDTTAAQWINTVKEAIDASYEPVVLVGHSAGCGVAHAAADERVTGVDRLIMVGGFPLPSGSPLLGEEFPSEDGLIPLPEFDFFSAEDLAGLNAPIREHIRAQAVPVPAQALQAPVHLYDEHRRQIPLTMVCTEYSSAQLREWMNNGFEPVQEITEYDQVQYFDLPTGHWPQFTRPRDLATILLGTVRE